MKKVYNLGGESSIFPKDKNMKIKYQNVLEHDKEIQKKHILQTSRRNQAIDTPT